MTQKPVTAVDAQCRAKTAAEMGSFRGVTALDKREEKPLRMRRFHTRFS